MMGRRGFLKLLGVGVLGMSLALRAPDVPKAPEVFSVDFEWTEYGSDDYLLDAADRYLGPAAESIAAEWDARAGVSLYDHAAPVWAEAAKHQGNVTIRMPKRYRI